MNQNKQKHANLGINLPEFGLTGQEAEHHVIVFFNSIRECIEVFSPKLFNITTQSGRIFTRSFIDCVIKSLGLARTDLVTWIKSAKSWCAWTLSTHLRMDEIAPGFIQLLTGPLLRFVKCRLNWNTHKATAFAVSLSQSKRGTLAVPECFIANQLLKHAKTLSKVSPEFSEEFAEEVSGIIDEILADFNFGREVFADDYEPSSASTNVTSVAGGGAYAELFSRTHPSCDVVRTQGGDINLHLDDELLAMNHGGSDLRGFQKQVSIDDLLLQEPDVEPCWVVQPVLEPFKVRVITKGPALLQYVGKGLQKAIHAYLRRLYPFRALDHPLDISDLDSFFQRSHQFWKKGSKPLIISGDYSAATDGLYMGLSKLCMDRILARYTGGADEQVVMRFNAIRKTIGEATVKYSYKYFGDYFNSSFKPISEEVNKCLMETFGTSEPDSDGFFRTRMQNGQLMGSISSFPILCILNMACYIYSVRRQNHSLCPKRWVDIVSQWPLFVNGDDILFLVSTFKEYKHWSSCLSTFGFEKSLGKNLYSTSICQINSQLYRTSVYGTVYLPYFPVGLLTGTAKVSGRSWEIAERLPQAIWNDIKSFGQQYGVVKYLYKRYLFYNHVTLQKLSLKGLVNYNIPTFLGGLGLIVPWDIKTTRLQRAVLTSQFYEFASNALLKGNAIDGAFFAKSRHIGRKVLSIADHLPRGTSLCIVKGFPKFRGTNTSRINLPLVTVGVAPFEESEDSQGTYIFTSVLHSKHHVSLVNNTWINELLLRWQWGQLNFCLTNSPWKPLMGSPSLLPKYSLGLLTQSQDPETVLRYLNPQIDLSTVGSVPEWQETAREEHFIIGLDKADVEIRQVPANLYD